MRVVYAIKINFKISQRYSTLARVVAVAVTAGYTVAAVD